MNKRVTALVVLALAVTPLLAASQPAAVSDQAPGLQVAIDPATGKLRQPTAEESQQLAKSFMETLQLHPLVPRLAADGTLSIVLDDSMANFFLARVTDGGALVFHCVNDPAAAIEVLTTPASIMRRPGAPATASAKPAVLEEK